MREWAGIRRGCDGSGRDVARAVVRCYYAWSFSAPPEFEGNPPMANSAQARKRARQAIVTNKHNASLRSSLRTAVKQVRKAISAGDKAAAQLHAQGVASGDRSHRGQEDRPQESRVADEVPPRPRNQGDGVAAARIPASKGAFGRPFAFPIEQERIRRVNRFGSVRSPEARHEQRKSTAAVARQRLRAQCRARYPVRESRSEAKCRRARLLLHYCAMRGASG